MTVFTPERLEGSYLNGQRQIRPREEDGLEDARRDLDYDSRLVDFARIINQRTRRIEPFRAPDHQPPDFEVNYQPRPFIFNRLDYEGDRTSAFHHQQQQHHRQQQQHHQRHAGKYRYQ